MYTVYGYTCDCHDFEYSFDSFVAAVQAFRKLEKMNVVFFKREGPRTCLHVR